MTVVRVESLTVSLDGYVAGPNQSLESPMGDGTSELHKWAFSTRTFQEKVLGTNAGATGVDDDIAARGFTNIGAWILGRNMFGPIRGPWPNEDWKGWWGENPPYHVPAFVLTHHPRKTLEMEGGTTFHFVTGGVREALALARDAAGAQDVRMESHFFKVSTSASLATNARSKFRRSSLHTCSSGGVVNDARQIAEGDA